MTKQRYTSKATWNQPPKDWGLNTIDETKLKRKPVETVDEYGNKAIKCIFECPRKND